MAVQRQQYRHTEAVIEAEEEVVIGEVTPLESSIHFLVTEARTEPVEKPTATAHEVAVGGEVAEVAVAIGTEHYHNRK